MHKNIRSFCIVGEWICVVYVMLIALLNITINFVNTLHNHALIDFYVVESTTAKIYELSSITILGVVVCYFILRVLELND